MRNKNIFLAGIFLFFALAVFGFYVFGATVGEVSHPANQIKPGKFQLGDYFFPGRVGIGKNSTNHTLDVNGDISALSIDIAGTIRARDVFSSGGQNLIIGDDTFLTDIDSANILGYMDYKIKMLRD